MLENPSRINIIVAPCMLLPVHLSYLTSYLRPWVLRGVNFRLLKYL